MPAGVAAYSQSGGFYAVPAANATVWAYWNSGLYTAGTSSSTVMTNDAVWAYWNNAYAGQVIAAGTGSTLLTAQVWAGWNTVYTETREQRAGRARQAADAETRRSAERAARVTANARAEQLLFSLLSDEQARTFREHGWFEVLGSRGRRWRIRNRGQAGNVDLMPAAGNERDATFCAHPPDHLPDCDAYVAQMLHLVTDEDDFRRVANKHWERPGRRVAVPEIPRQGGAVTMELAAAVS